MVLDLRTGEEKLLIRQNQNTRTLRKDYDIWQERPRIVAVEQGSADSTLFSHMVERLYHMGQIVHVTIGEDISQIEYIFHEDKVPFKELQRIKVPREHFRFCIVVKAILPVPHRNMFASVLFANGCSETPSKAVHFTRKDKYSFWSQPEEY